MPKNRIVVEGPIDYENTLEGDNFLYDVKSCDVDPEKGSLVWDRIIFPKMPTSTDAVSLGPMISRNDPRTNHVSSMQRVGDDVLQLLRDRGVDVVIIDNPSPTVTCGD